MQINKNVTIGEQFGVINVNDEEQVTVNMTNLKGQVSLAELRAVAREAGALARRLGE